MSRQHERGHRVAVLELRVVREVRLEELGLLLVHVGGFDGSEDAQLPGGVLPVVRAAACAQQGKPGVRDAAGAAQLSGADSRAGRKAYGAASHPNSVARPGTPRGAGGQLGAPAPRRSSQGCWIENLLMAVLPIGRGGASHRRLGLLVRRLFWALPLLCSLQQYVVAAGAGGEDIL